MRSTDASDSQARESMGERLAAGLTRTMARRMLRSVQRRGVPVEQRRTRYARLFRMSPAPRGIAYTAGVIRGGVAGEAATVKRVPSSGRTILYLHGGGYCIGTAATSRVITGNLARQCAAEVFAAEYRLAPEHPFPAGLDDAVAAYRGLLDAGAAPGSIVIAGDSAGAGLAVATALRLRDLDLPRPAALVLFSPWVDLDPAALGPDRAGDVMAREFIEECTIQYLAGHPVHDPLASPVGADLRRLPPTLIQVGGDELLLSQSRRLAAALLAAGVVVELQEYPRRWHVFQQNAPSVADARRALEAVASFLTSQVEARVVAP